MSTHFSRLKLKVQAPLKLKDLTYKFVVTTNSSKKKIVFDGRFNEQGLTDWTQINNLNTTLIYEIYLRGELLQKVSVKAYPDKKTHSVYTLKTTTEITKKAKENIKEIYLNNGEVAWYLVKKSEPVMTWAQRVFKKPLTEKDWGTLKANNPHLTNLVTMGVLQPGQVVIISNSTTAKELPEYKKQAQQANDNLEKMKKDKDFDAVFFAQNYEFFYDALLQSNAKIVKKNIFKEDGHPLTIKFNKEEEDGFFEQRMAVDASLSLVEGQAHRVYRLHGELAQKYAEEQAKGSGLANPKNFTQFKQKYADLYRKLDNEGTKKFLRWDQSIKTTNMRRILKKSALVRDNNFKGGLREYAKEMGKIGKYATQLKIAGYVSIATDVVSSGITVYDAAPADKARTTVVETAKVGTGLVAGAVVSAIVIGLATGGTGLIVIGIVAATGAMATKSVSEIAGYGVGEAYDYIDEIRNK